MELSCTLVGLLPSVTFPVPEYHNAETSDEVRPLLWNVTSSIFPLNPEVPSDFPPIASDKLVVILWVFATAVASELPLT